MKQQLEQMLLLELIPKQTKKTVKIDLYENGTTALYTSPVYIPNILPYNITTILPKDIPTILPFYIPYISLFDTVVKWGDPPVPLPPIPTKIIE